MLGSDPKTFVFTGNCLSLQATLDHLSSEDANRFIDASINVVGLAVKGFDSSCYTCTLIWGSVFIFPLCFLCCDCWQKRTYPAFSVPTTIYESLGAILKGSNLRNINLTVKDNTFNAAKAEILYRHLTSSGIRGFTFTNTANNYDFDSN